MPTDLKTDTTLLDRLRAAAGVEMTPEEVRRQRISFVYGNLPSDSDMTKNDVERVLNRLEGATA